MTKEIQDLDLEVTEETVEEIEKGIIADLTVKIEDVVVIERGLILEIGEDLILETEEVKEVKIDTEEVALDLIVEIEEEVETIEIPRKRGNFRLI